MSAASDSYPVEPRNRVKRLHERGRHDRESVHAILDAARVCHVGYVIDGQPYVTPTMHWREGERLYWHGSAASRMLRAVKQAVPVCVTVTLFDGLVLARSAFNHSANYRAAMVFGRARAVEDADEKEAALDRLMDILVPGRRHELRPNSARELKATTVVAMEIETASAKISAGPPEDDAEDYETATCWAGVLPSAQVWGAPIPDPTPHPSSPGTMADRPVPEVLRRMAGKAL